MSQKIKRIILIDDDPEINYLNRLIVNQKQCAEEIIEFDSAADALEFIKNQKEPSTHYDLVFLDINMPHMNGWDFLEEYDKIPEQQQTANIVMLTSSISPADKTKADSIELIKDFRSKPLTFKMLDELIDHHYN